MDSFNCAAAEVTRAAHASHPHLHAHPHGLGLGPGAAAGGAGTACSCIKYIDITGYTREATADPSLIASDHLHPSAKDYERWASKVLKEIALHVDK